MMHGKTTLKILLDLVMSILFGLLLWDTGAGAFFHEVAGIGIGVLFLLHIALNRKPVKGLARAAAAGSASKKGAFMLLLDLLLTIGMSAVILSGVLMSRVLFSFEAGIRQDVLFQVHFISSYVCLGILAVHLAMHAEYLKKAVVQITAHRRQSGVWKTASRFAAAALAIGVLYLYAFSAYKNNLSASLDYAAVSSPAGTSSVISSDTSSQTSSQTSSEPSSATTSETQSTTKKEDGDASVSAGSSDTQAVPISLSEYLSKLYCTGSHNLSLSKSSVRQVYPQIQESRMGE
jgi:hypothetical protein